MRYMYLLMLMLCMPAYAGTLSPYTGPLMADVNGYQLQVEGEKYDLSRLQSFNRYKVEMQTLWTEKSTFVGVKLVDVLKDAGIQDYKLLYVEALNDYEVTLSGDELGIDSALIVLQKNGSLLPLSDKGAFWLVWPSLEQRLLKGVDNGAKWVWNLSTIRKVK